MSVYDGRPAFPNAGSYYTGMSLRDWFASQALRELINASRSVPDITIPMIARDAYRFADAMISERGKKGA